MWPCSSRLSFEGCTPCAPSPQPLPASKMAAPPRARLQDGGAALLPPSPLPPPPLPSHPRVAVTSLPGVQQPFCLSSAAAARASPSLPPPRAAQLPFPPRGPPRRMPPRPAARRRPCRARRATWPSCATSPTSGSPTRPARRATPRGRSARRPPATWCAAAPSTTSGGSATSSASPSWRWCCRPSAAHASSAPRTSPPTAPTAPGCRPGRASRRSTGGEVSGGRGDNRVRLGIRRRFWSEREVRRWDGSRREAGGSPCLGGCKERLDLVIRDEF